MAGVKVTCETCQKEFSVKPYLVNTRRWCSNPCRRNRVTITCQSCRRQFEVPACRRATAKWCSRDCAGTEPLDFWSCVTKSEDCWVWIAGADKDGYGKFGDTRAHRASYEMAYGMIPVGLSILHKCDNPPCVRPDHLFAGTSLDNMRDKVEKGRQPRGERLGGIAKLSEHQVRQIRQMAAEGVKHNDIAALFGVDRTNVGCIVRRKTWSHVT